jgi:hypothetical protein
MIDFAVDGPTPGKVSSCSAVAVLIFTLLPALLEGAVKVVVVVSRGFIGAAAPGTVTGGNVVREGRKRGATVGCTVRVARAGT